jgi:hypothetical protein
MKGILWLALDSHTFPVECIYNPVQHLHVTLEYGVNYESCNFLIGRKVEVIAVANCWNDKVQALRVNLPPEYDAICDNVHPHMTISTADNVRPVESNNMLSGEYNELPVQIVMQTTVDFIILMK